MSWFDKYGWILVALALFMLVAQLIRHFVFM
jgi:hypothetical protein